MERSGENNRATLRLIVYASFACLSFELALMRAFSISLSYHFAFMVLSIAMLGIGASGTALSVFPGLNDLRRVPLYGLMLGVSIPASYLLPTPFPSIRRVFPGTGRSSSPSACTTSSCASPSSASA